MSQVTVALDGSLAAKALSAAIGYVNSARLKGVAGQGHCGVHCPELLAPIVQPLAALRFIAREFEPSLLGSRPFEKALVEEWLSVCHVDLFPNPSSAESVLQRLELQLRNATFIAGPNISIADLAVYVAVHRAIAQLTEAQRDVPSLVRWFSTLQALSAASSGLTLVPIAIAPSALYGRVPSTPPFVSNAAQSPAVPGGSAAKPSAAAPAPAPAPAPAASGPSAIYGRIPAPPYFAAGSHSAPAPAPAAPVAAAADSAPKGQAQAPKQAAEKKDKAAKAPAASAAKPAENKPKAEKAPKPAETKEKDDDDDSSGLDIGRVDIRVGQIVKAEKHPKADKLYVEEVNLGSETRTVVSGLAEHIPLEKVAKQGLCVVMVNLKPVDMLGVTSTARMLVATGKDGKKQIITPPAGAKVGEKVSFKGVSQAPDSTVKDKKLHKIFKELKTNDKGVAVYRDLEFLTGAGPVTAPDAPNGTVA